MQTLSLEKKKAIRFRLVPVEGQLLGLQRMIEEDADCELVTQQLSVARNALGISVLALVSCIIELGETPPESVAAMLTEFA